VNRSTVEEPALSGAWAEQIVLREGTTVVRVPDGVDHLAAMSPACAGPTMVHTLYERRPVRLDETVVVQGSGPVGLAAAVLAELGRSSTGSSMSLARGPSQAPTSSNTCG
jgi:NADPH:quinone reductase-like Zn-dependent oxidoreductase